MSLDTVKADLYQDLWWIGRECSFLSFSNKTVFSWQAECPYKASPKDFSIFHNLACTTGAAALLPKNPLLLPSRLAPWQSGKPARKKKALITISPQPTFYAQPPTPMTDTRGKSQEAPSKIKEQPPHPQN